MNTAWLSPGLRLWRAVTTTLDSARPLAALASRVYIAQVQLQNATDAAALAAGRLLCVGATTDAIKDEAVRYGEANAATIDRDLIVIGDIPISEAGDGSSVAYVNVPASQVVPQFFWRKIPTSTWKRDLATSAPPRTPIASA